MANGSIIKKSKEDRLYERAERKIKTGKQRLIKKYGYDYEGAKQAGIQPDETGHWASRNPDTGEILKGKKHPTFKKTVVAEKQIGNKVFKVKGGKRFSLPKDDKIAIKATKWIYKKGIKE